MELNESKEILKNNGFLVEDTLIYSALSDFYRYLMAKAPKNFEIEGNDNNIIVKFNDNIAKVTLEQFEEDEDPMLYVEAGNDFRAFYNEHTDYGNALQFIIKNIYPTNESANESTNYREIVTKKENNMQIDEAKQILKNAGFLVETNKRSADFYYRAKVFEKIQQIFDENAAIARKTNPNVRGFKVDTLKAYIRAYGYQDLNKLIDGEFEAGAPVKETAEKCIDWFKDIVEREG